MDSIWTLQSELRGAKLRRFDGNVKPDGDHIQQAAIRIISLDVATKSDCDLISGIGRSSAIVNSLVTG